MLPVVHMVRGLVILTASAVVGLVAVTVLALEGREVVVLRSIDDTGAPRETRTWIADDGGYSWVEAANPERPFLRNIVQRPVVDVRRGTAVASCRARAWSNPEGHALIRRLLAAKYGWADRWIGMLTDTSRSVAVRLDCR